MAYSGGLKKWFKEDWRDLKTGKKCGRSGSEKGSRPYPACRPAKAAKKMTASEKKAVGARKTSKARVSYPVTPGGKRKKKAKRK